ncbi:MAG: PKD domain-containing protein [Candidatus Helarchaeota archaeon]
MQLLEGNTHVFVANSSDTPSDFPALDHAWSFGKDGWRASYLARDDGLYLYNVTVTDPEGAQAVDHGEIQVTNVDPRVSITSANAIGNITITMTGTPNNTYGIKYLVNGIPMINYSHPRVAGNPNSQAETFPIDFNLNDENVIQIYNISSDVTEGANPTWVTFSFPDGNEFTLYHVFNHDPNQASSLNWTIPLDDLYYLMSLTMKGSVFDPGLSDDVEGSILYNGQNIANFSNEVVKNAPEYAGVTDFSVLINSSSGQNVLNVTAWDDDGGQDSAQVVISKQGSIMDFINLAPDVIFLDGVVGEDVNKTYVTLASDWQNDQLSYMYVFGDGVSEQGQVVPHSFTNEGEYIVKVEVSDGVASTTKAILQDVVNLVPEVDILGIFTTYEDEELTFQPHVKDSNCDVEELRYLWDFGDGIIAHGKDVNHSWSRSGLYDLHVQVFDDNGAVGEATVPVNVSDSPPLIEGKYGFEGLEGTVLVLDVQARDSTVDEPNLFYNWVLDGFNLSGKKASMWSDDANYTGNLTIIDQGTGLATSANISAFFINLPAQVYASTFINYGVSRDISFKAFATDSFVDMNDLTYSWTMDGIPVPDGSGIFSSVLWSAETTGLYTGTVTVTDDSESSSDAQFQVAVTMDGDGDGISDEQELILNLSPDDADSDEDWITDWYEIHVYNTSPYLADTDGDGLADGFDVMLGAGELTLGTDPRHEDTDRDNLTDGFEVVGWNIEDPHDSSNMIPVQSNPLKLDSDGDGLSDWEEWYYWTEVGIPLDPKNPDTDGNGVEDREQVGLGIKYDSDGDGLTDAEELGERHVVLLEELLLDESSSFEFLDYLTVTGDIANTHVPDGFMENEAWTGSYQVLSSELSGISPEKVVFEGVFTGLTMPNYTLTFHVSMVATPTSMGYLTLWNETAQEWVIINEYTKSSDIQISYFIDQENYLKCLDGEGKLKIRIESGIYSYEGLDTLHESKVSIDHAAAQALHVYHDFHSDPTKADTDDDGLDDWEEWYPGSDGFITNPKNNDTDGDALLDSAESYTSIKELPMRKNIAKNEWRTFTFDASFGHTVVNASVTIAISVGEETDTPTNLDVEVLVSGTLIFTNSSQDVRYYCNITEVSLLVAEKVGSFTGQWTLRVKSTEDAMLENFKVEVTQRLNPLMSDFDGDTIPDGHELNPELNDGWVTNPAVKDSDGDGWSDFHEINVTGTNPTSRDTDGDTVPDAQDIDPLHDLIVNVTLIQGHDGGAWWPWHLLAMVLNVEGQVAVSTYQPYTSGYEVKGYWFLWWFIITYAAYTTATFNSKYYFDVPDNDATVSLSMSLWRMEAYPNIGTKIMEVGLSYALEQVGHSQAVTQWSGASWVSYNVSTLGLERVNTIAVHQNGSFTSDRYPAIETMNVLLLGVTDDDPAHPEFQQGINAILIPTSLFVNTKLHALIERAVDDAGTVNDSLIPAVLAGADFLGMDRSKGQVDKHVDSVITKSGLTAAQAWEILQLCLIFANESEGVIYLYTVVNATLVNIAPDVLKLIPVDGSVMQNSAQGTLPRTWTQFWQQLGLDILFIFVTVLIVIALVLLSPILLIVLIGFLVLSGFGGAVLAAIEAVVKAIILFFIFILLALIIIVLIIIIGVLALLIVPATLLLGGQSYYGVTNVQSELYSQFFFLGFLILFEFNEFLDLNIPFISFQIKLNDLKIINLNLGLLSPLTSVEDSILPGGSDNPLYIPTDIANGLGSALGTVGSLLIIGVFIDFMMDVGRSILILSIAWSVTLIGWILYGFPPSSSWQLGFGVGLIFCFVTMLLAFLLSKSWTGMHPGSEAASAATTFSIVSIILSALGLSIQWIDNLFLDFILMLNAFIQVILGYLVLKIGLNTLAYGVVKHPSSTVLIGAFACLGLGLFLVFTGGLGLALGNL